jgi:tetratricopeptide (TPR) repeat protein
MSGELKVITPWQDCFIISFSDTAKAILVDKSGKKVLEDLDVIGMSQAAFLELLTIQSNKLLSTRIVISSFNNKPILIYNEGLKGGGACFSKLNSKSSYYTNITQEGGLVTEPNCAGPTQCASGSPEEAERGGAMPQTSTEDFKMDIPILLSLNVEEIQEQAYKFVTDTVEAVRSEDMSKVRIIELSRVHPYQINIPQNICIELLKMLSEELLWVDSWARIRHEIARMARRYGFAFFMRNMNSLKSLKGFKSQLLSMINQVKHNVYHNKSIVGDYGVLCELLALEYLYADIIDSKEWCKSANIVAPELIRNYIEQVEPESWEGIMIGYKKLRGRYHKNYLTIHSILDIIDSSIKTKQVFNMCLEKVMKNIEEFGWKEVYPTLHLFETAIYMSKIKTLGYSDYLNKRAKMFLGHKNYRIREKAASILSLLLRNQEHNVHKAAIKLLNETSIIEKHPAVMQVLAHPISSSEAYMNFLEPLIDKTAPKCHHNLNILPSILFGRKLELEAISNVLSQAGVCCGVSISGPEGIGKSSLAHQYSVLNIPKYDIIWWINSESQSSFNHSLYELASNLKLNLETSMQISNDLKLYLSNPKLSKLLVFDNIKDANMIDEFLPTDVHFIFISEHPIPDLYEVKLGPVSPEASLDLFRYNLNLEFDKYEFSDLSKLIGNSPIELVQAASYLNRTQSHLKELINILSYSTHKDELLKEIVFRNIEKLGNEGRFILKILCHVHNKLVPHYMLRCLFKERFKNVSILELNAYIKELRDLKILYYDISSNTFMVDTIIHRYIRLFFHSDDSSEIISSLKEFFLQIYKYDKNSKITLLKQLTPHIQVFLDHNSDLFDNQSFALINIELAQVLFYVYLDTLKGTPIIFDLFNSLNNLYLKDLTSAKVYHKLANLFRAIHDSKSAETCFMKSLDFHEILSASDTIERATVHNDLADLYLSLAEYNRAQENYIKALKFWEKFLRADHPLLASNYNSLGIIYLIKGALVRSKKFLMKSKDIREKILPSDSPFTASTYNSLGELYYTTKDYDRAEEYLLKSEDIRTSVLPEDSTHLAKTYNNLGLLYSAKNEPHLAFEYYRKSINIYEKVLKPNSIELAKLYHNLAGLYQSRKEYDLAKTFYIKSKRIYSLKSFDKINLANIYHNLATLYQTISEHEKAIIYYQRCLKIRVKELPPYSLSTAKTYFNAGCLCYKLGDLKNAEIMFTKCKEIRIKALGPDHPNSKELYKHFGMIFQARGMNRKAEVYFDMARD